MDNELKEKQLTHEDVAWVLGCSRPTVYAMIQRGELDTVLTPQGVLKVIEAKQLSLAEMQDRLNWYKS